MRREGTNDTEENLRANNGRPRNFPQSCRLCRRVPGRHTRRRARSSADSVRRQKASACHRVTRLGEGVFFGTEAQLYRFAIGNRLHIDVMRAFVGSPPGERIRLPSGEKAGYCLEPPNAVKGVNFRFASAGASRRENQTKAASARTASTQDLTVDPRRTIATPMIASEAPCARLARAATRRWRGDYGSLGCLDWYQRRSAHRYRSG